MMQSTKVKEVEDLKCDFFTTDKKVQSLEFSHLVFDLALGQYFLTRFCSLCFRMEMYIQSHHMMEVYDLILF